MSSVRMRPTFQLETKMSAIDAMKCIQASFRKSKLPDDPDQNRNSFYNGQFAGDHAMISIVDSKRHFWSPWMHLEIRANDTGQQIFGRFSPHPSIWTGFMFSYLSIGVIVFFAIMFGVSQQLSGQSPWAYYVIPIGLIIAMILWFAAKAGQNLAQDEMQTMKSVLEHCLENPAL